MTARSRAQAESSSDGDGGDGSDAGAGARLLAALLDDMETALCAFDAEGVVTHWNSEAESMLGWSAAETVGRTGFAGWAVRPADAEETEARLFGAVRAGGPGRGRQVHEFALLTKAGGRLLVRAQCTAVADPEGRPAGLYCAFSEVHAQIDLERSLALSEALFDDAAWGVVLVDADLRPAVINPHAAAAFRAPRSALLGRPLGELVDEGLEGLEGALQHVLAEGAPPAPAELWLTLRTDGPGAGPADGRATGRRCWRSAFVRLASSLAEEAVPLGVAWFFQDVTAAGQADQEASRLRFRDNQLNRATRAAAECADPMEAATVHLDFALAGFADHALLDLAPRPARTGAEEEGEDGAGGRLVRAAATPDAAPPGGPGVAGGIPVGYPENHPALQAWERCGSVRASAGRTGAGGAEPPGWAEERKWPVGSVHGLCAVLRSRGRTLGVVTFLRGASRRPFDRTDAGYAEDVAARVAAAVDLGHSLR